MDKITFESVMEEIKKSLGEARLMKIGEESVADTQAKIQNDIDARNATRDATNRQKVDDADAATTPARGTSTPAPAPAPATRSATPAPNGEKERYDDKVIKQEPKTSATPSSQEDQNKTGTSPATAGSQPQSTMASPGDRAAFDAKTGADKTRADAGAAELAQRTLKPLVPGGSTAPSAPGAVRPLSAPSAPIKPITGPTPPGAGAKPVSAPAAAAAKPEKFSGTIKDFQAKNAGATVGQAMNAIQGKTAIAGGANDPAKIAAQKQAAMGDKQGPVQVYNPGKTAPAAGASVPKPAAPAAARPSAPASPARPSAPAALASPAASSSNLSKVTPGSAADSMRKRYAPGGGGSAGNTPMVAENFDQFVKKFLKESR